MSKFIFLAAACVLLIAGVGCGRPDASGPAVQSPVDAAEEQCSGQAKTFFDNFVGRQSVPFSDAKFVSHWNATRGRCFVSITGNLEGHAVRTVYDAVGKQEYGLLISGKATSTCEVSADGAKTSMRNCASADEYDTLEKSLMNE